MKYDLKCKCGSDNTQTFSFHVDLKEYICVRCLDCKAEWVILVIDWSTQREYERV